MVNIQTLKGFRDIPPEEALKRGRVLSLLKSVFKSYGFAPLETPTLEYAEVLEGKYGPEADKLIYKFQDRGGRDAALRYDLTVPLARYIAQNKGAINFPFKRYQIGSIFRAEKPQAGRYRESTQVDVDTVGINSALADAEILAVIASALQLLGVKKFTIRINDRTVFGNLPAVAIRILDKMDKVGQEGVQKELERAGFDAGKILDQAKAKPTGRLEEIFSLLNSFGIPREVWKFDPLLARGLDYYTGMVYEVFVPGVEYSISGGGRYDKMIGMFSGQEIPAVGGSFGLDRLVEIIPEETFAEIPFQPRVLVTIFSPELLNQSIRLFDQLQSQGVESELYLDPNAKLDKQLKYADRKEIPYALILGPEEEKSNRATLKNLKEGTQQTLALETILKALVK